MVSGFGRLVLMVTFSVFGGVEPHVLFAVTETAPPVVPDVARMELVVEVPVHPGGNIQV